MNELRKFELESLYQSFKNNENTYLHTAYVEADDKVHYYTDKDVRDYSKEYFTIESLEDGNEIKWISTQATSARYQDISISVDLGKTWNVYKANTTGVLVATLNKGDKLFAKGTNSGYGTANGQTKFISSKKFIVYGNIMSLINESTYKTNKTLGSYAFAKAFYQNSNLISSENLILPATTLADSTYSSMFSGCANLLYPPKVLPATSVPSNAYNSMFSDSPKILKTPEILGTTFQYRGAYGMFIRDYNLKEVKLANNITCTGNQAFYRAFKDCSSLEKVNSYLNLSCGGYTEVFLELFTNCSKLKGPIELHLSGSVYSSFSSLFSGCSQLNGISLDSTIWYPTLFFNCYNLSDFTVITSPTTVYNQVFGGTQVILNNSDITNVTTHESRYYTVSDAQNVPLYNEDIMLFWGNSSNNIFIPTNYSTEAFDLTDRVLTLKVATIAPQQQNNWNYIYYNCTKVQGTDVTLIKEHAFKGFKDLEEIDLPNAWIASQGWNTLQNCSNLKKVKLAGIEGTGGEYLFNYSGVIVEIVEFTKACDVTGQGAAAGAGHATWPNKAMKIVLPDDLCSIRSTAAFSTDTIFYVSSQAKIQEYLAYSNWATIGAERFKLKSELEE